MSDDIATKSEFAALTNVHPSRVSQWLSQRKIHGAAIVGEGRHARIRVTLAKEQLRQTLHTDQRIGANARAQLDGSPAAPAAPLSPAPPTMEEKLKLQRLEQYQLANERAREDRAARVGIYTRADDARREMGRLASDLLMVFDSALVEFATAIAAKSNLSSRDAVHLLRKAWRSIRERSADRETETAASLPMLIAEGEREDDAGETVPPSEPSDSEEAPT
jgi:hypothetical protein